MNNNTELQQRNFRGRAAGLVRTALASAAAAALLCAPAAAAFVSAPTGAALPRGLPVLVQWTPSHWPSSVVRVFLNRIVPGGSYPVGNAPLAANVPNNGQAYVNVPQSLPCDPAHVYTVSVEGAVNSHTTAHGESAKFRFLCEGGSLKVNKTVINDSGGPVPNGAFSVAVTCLPNGPNTTLTLSNANNFQDTVTYIPPGGQCTIKEEAPKAPRGCRWSVSYPKGKTAVIGNPPQSLEVRNRLSCKGGLTLSSASVSLGTGVVLVNDTVTASACCSPNWNSVPASSYLNPAIIAACSAATQAQCISNAAINCLWNTQDPDCRSAPAVSCADPAHVPPYNTGGSAANNVPVGQCYKDTAGQCVYNWRVPGVYTGGQGWITGCPDGIAGDNCCRWNGGSGADGSDGECCTRQLPGGSAGCGASSRNPPAAAAQARCLAVGDRAAQKGCNWDPGCGGGTGTGCCLKRDPKTESFVNCPGFPAGAAKERCKAPCQWDPLNDPGCRSDDSPETRFVTVTKKIRNRTSTPTPSTPFQVRLDCMPNGPHQVVALTSPNSLQQTVSVPRGSDCAIAEIPPVAPRACHWETSYPNDQEGKTGAKFLIENELLCDEKPTGSLTVTKKVTEPLASEPAPDITFHILVTCSNGFSQMMNLGRDESKTVSGLPAGTTCTLTESIAQTSFLSFPRSCRNSGAPPANTPGVPQMSDMGLSSFVGPALWKLPAYSPGQTVTISAGSSAVSVINGVGCFVGTLESGAGGGKR